MQLINAPGKLTLPFANAGAKNTIPVASQIGIVAGAASLTDGFPPLTRTPIAAGGVPPSGLDMNGILFELSAIARWLNGGGGFTYDATFATDVDVGGYPKGARIMRSDGTGYWLNTADNNTTDPEGAGAAAAGWVPDFTSGLATVAMASANVTLTAAEYGKPIIVITGTLTANLSLIFPDIAGEWQVINNTAGAFAITCKTAAGTGVVVNSIQKVVGDGVNIYGADADAVAMLGTLAASAGGTADALTAAVSPAPHRWIAGVPYLVRAAAANTSAAPTFTPNSGTLAAKTIVKGANAALLAGDIAGAGHWLVLQYDGTLDKVVLLNPAYGVSDLSHEIQPVAASVAGNALTLTLNPTTLDFRSATLTNGTVNQRTVAAPISLTISSGSTLGTVNGQQARIAILAIDNAGTVELAAVNLSGGVNLDETTLISTTAEGGGGAADSASTIYSTTARTNVPFRVVGFVDITEATAGTWATGPTLVQGVGGQALAAMASLGYGQTWQNLTASRTLGTTYYNTTGKPIAVHIYGQLGTAAAAFIITVNGLAITCAPAYTTNAFSVAYAIIPAGASYSVAQNTGTATLQEWRELR